MQQKMAIFFFISSEEINNTTCTNTFLPYKSYNEGDYITACAANCNIKGCTMMLLYMYIHVQPVVTGNYWNLPYLPNIKTIFISEKITVLQFKICHGCFLASVDQR